MNGRLSKKIRREVSKLQNASRLALLSGIKDMTFKQRAKFCYRIMFKKQTLGA